MNPPGRGWCWVAALIAISLALQVGLCGLGSLYNETDGQYAGAARTMADGGSWLIPENNGIPRLVKPPLLVWMMAASLSIFGENEFAARLPGALGVVAWVVATAAISAVLLQSWRVGFFSGVVLLTFLGSATLGRIIMPEPWFAAWITWAIFCAVRVLESGPADRRRGWAIGFWFFAGLACMTKGWHGAIYPAAIAIGAGLWIPGWRRNLKSLASGWGVLLFLAICVPWHVAVESRYPGFLANLLFVEQAGHLTGSDAPATSYSVVPRGQFVLLHLGWFFPWSVAVIAGLISRGPDVWSGFREWIALPSVRLGLVWIGLVLASVMVAGQRQDYYAMTLWPAVAMLVAGAFRDGWPRSALAVPCGLAVMGAIVFAAVLQSAGSSSGGPRTVAERATAWATLTGLDSAVWQGLARLGLGAFLAAAVVLAIGLIFHRHLARGWIALAATGGIFCLAGAWGTANLAPYFSLASMAPVLRDLPAETLLVFDGGIDTGSSLLFYSDRTVHLLGQDPDTEFATRTFGIGRDRFLTDVEFSSAWHGGRPVALVTERSRMTAWEQRLGPIAAPVAASGTQVLLRNPLSPAD